MADLWCSLLEALRVVLVQFLLEIFSASFLCSVILVHSCLPVSPIYIFSHWLHGILYNTPAFFVLLNSLSLSQLFSHSDFFFPSMPVSLSGIIHHSHSFTRLEIYHHIYFNIHVVQNGYEENVNNLVLFHLYIIGHLNLTMHVKE